MSYSLNPIVRDRWGLRSSQDDLSTLETAGYGTIATGADAVASIANSLTFWRDEPLLSTEDMLRDFSPDALNVYNEHTDAIQFASLLAGSLIPGGLALKGIKAARAGVKGIDAFDTISSAVQLKRAESLFSQGIKAHDQYKKAKRLFYAKYAGEQAVDLAVTELAVLGSMGEHAYMEDYMENFATNFALNMAFGAGLTAIPALLSSRRAVRSLIASNRDTPVAQALQEANLATIQGVAEGDQYAVAALNEQRLSDLLKARKETMAPVVQEAVEAAQKELQVKKERHAAVLLSGNDKITTSGSAEKAAWVEDSLFKENVKRILEDPSVANIDKLRFANPYSGYTLGKSPFRLMERVKLGGKSLRKKAEEAGEARVQSAVWSPQYGMYVAKEHVAGISTAADLGDSWQTYQTKATKLPRSTHQIPRYDFVESTLVAPTAEIEGDLLTRIAYYEKLSDTELMRTNLHADDVNSITAYLHTLKQREVIPETVRVIKGKYVAATEEDAFQHLTKGHKGVPKDYWTQAEAIVTKKDFSGNLVTEAANLSPRTKEEMRIWQGGRMQRLRDAAYELFHRSPHSYKITESHKAIEELLSSEARKSAQNAFKQIADEDGYVYLWRGTPAGDVVGHKFIESYSISRQVAKRFSGSGGSVSLHRVAVSDILGVMQDLGYNEREILALSPTKQALESANSTPVRTDVKPVTATGKGGYASDYHPTELRTHLEQLKVTKVQEGLRAGRSPEEIAASNNLEKDVVDHIAAMGKLPDPLNYGKDPLNKISPGMDFDTYLSPGNRILEVSASDVKNPFPEMYGGWKNDTLNKADVDIKSSLIQASDSDLVRSLDDLLSGRFKDAIDSLRAGAWADFSPGKVAAHFLSSSDFTLRDVGYTGMIATAMGKSVEHAINQEVAKLSKPLRNLQEVIRGDEVAMVELNSAVQLYKRISGHKGQIKYEDRKFWTSRQAKDAEGKPTIVWDEAKWFDDYEGTAIRDFTVQSDDVDAWLQQMTTVRQEILELKNTIRGILGQSPIRDKGYWLPVNSPVGKERAYIEWPGPVPQIEMVLGETVEHLENQLAAIRGTVEAKGGKIIKAGTDQELWSRLNGRDYESFIVRPDPTRRASGASAQAIVPTDARVFAEVSNTILSELNMHGRNLVELAISDVFDHISHMSAIERATAPKATSRAGKVIASLHGTDSSGVVKNIFLGRSQLKDSYTWRSLNDSLTLTAETAIRGIMEVVSPLLEVGKRTKDPVKLYKAYDEAAKQRGVFNPFDGIFEADRAKAFAAGKSANVRNVPERLVHLQNSVASTILLRAMELAQPIVNMVSVPIMAVLAGTHQMPAHIGAVKNALKPGSTVNPITVMLDGTAAIFTRNAKKAEVMGILREQGAMRPIVSEATEALAFSRVAEGSALSKVEGLLDNALIDVLSKPADFAETATREWAANIGYALAKRVYGDQLDVNSTVVFIRDFIDKSIGNYTAPQRPTMFQGTLGTSLGLFQTYMLTMAQNIARKLEVGDYRNLVAAAGAQSAVFGTSSLPGFEWISKYLGEHYSDEHVDLETGIHRAFDPDIADSMLYGLPSSLSGSYFSSRGTLEVIPRTFETGPAGVAVATQLIGNTAQIIGSAMTDSENRVQSLLEGISLYSINRPIARMAELLSGYSTTRAGNTMATVETTDLTGIYSRLMGVRPLAEAKIRQANHLNTYYGQVDSKNRQEAVNMLRTAMRDKQYITSEEVSMAAERYLRAGTLQGFRSALTDAIAFAPVGMEHKMANSIPADSPVFYMLNNLD